MSTYKDVYGILNLAAMPHYDEKEDIFEFDLWQSLKESNLIDPLFVLETDFISDCVHGDPYELINENIRTETGI